MTTGMVRAILATDQHLLVGEVPTGGHRLRESLTDPRTRFVEILNVHVCRRTAMSDVVETLPRAVVVKESVRLAVIGGTQHEAPDKRRTRFVEKPTYRGFLIVSGFEVRGQLHIQGSSDEVMILSSDLETYMPVTQATLTFEGSEPIAASVVLVNRAYISMLQVGAKPGVAQAML